MTDRLEKDVENNARELAKKLGMLCYKFTSPGTVGVCDRMFVYEGRVFFIEFKKPGEPVKSHQVRHHVRMANHGITVYVVDNSQDAEDILRHEQTTNGPHRSAIRRADCKK